MTHTPWSVAVCLALLSSSFASVALADDFKTINGKEYKNATVSRIEPDGIVLKTKSGISKVYFIELPKDVQGRFRPTPRPSPAKTAAAQREPEPIKLVWWRAVVANPTAFIIIVLAAVIILVGVVFAIVRRRVQ